VGGREGGVNTTRKRRKLLHNPLVEIINRVLPKTLDLGFYIFFIQNLRIPVLLNHSTEHHFSTTSSAGQQFSSRFALRLDFLILLHIFRPQIALDLFVLRLNLFACVAIIIVICAS
jgi:hypothetical protein